jgi:hypothetical protein
VPAVDPDMVLVAEGRDREVDAGCTLRAWLGLGVFDRPARVAVLLAKLGGLVRPFRRNAAFLDVALFAVGVALLGCGDDRRVNDLPAFGQEPGRRQSPLKAREQDFDRRFTLSRNPFPTDYFALKGNHEELMTAFLDDPSIADHWRRGGAWRPCIPTGSR